MTASPIPHELNLIRGFLGDAGIPHSLHSTKTGKPYILFDRDVENDRVSLQFRQRRTDRATKVVTEAYFQLFINRPGETKQVIRRFDAIPDVLAYLGLDEAELASCRARRGLLTVKDRAISVEDNSTELTVFRGCLGDAGIAHRLHSQVGRKSYITFQHPASGANVVMQYRRSGRSPETGEFIDPHFAVAIRAPGSDTQTKLTLASLEDAIAFLEVPVADLVEGRERREGLSETERAMSVVPAHIEQSYISMMR